MDVIEIRHVGRGLAAYLAEFSDCFGRCDTEAYLSIYVRGQHSDLHRKSAEPIALQAGVAPRSLQAFLSLLSWDEDRMVDRVQEIVMRDHAHPYAIGVVDETGSPKKGCHTAGVQPQWCGARGKVDNCVVSVHIGYTAGWFHCLLDSDLFLPKGWANDPARRKKAGIPDDVRHRRKWQIALAQIERALANGVRVAAWTFDEHYGQSYEFLDGLDRLGQTYVAEVPPDFCGWATPPQLLYRATPSEMRNKGKKRRFPRLAKSAAKVSEVRDLLRYSPAFRQAWMPIHVKEGEVGPMVREVKAITFWMHRRGLPTRPHWLIAARNPTEPEEVKFFVSNAPAGSPLEWLTYVGYSRWPIEQCFKEEKDELGFDHFEVRGWQSIHRHMYLTQVSHLYLNRMREELTDYERDQEDEGFFSRAGKRRRSPGVSGGESDSQSDPGRGGSLVPSPAAWAPKPESDPGPSRLANQLSAASKHASPYKSSQKDRWEAAGVAY